MTTTHHTAIATGAAANAAVINAPLGQLDAAVVAEAGTRAAADAATAASMAIWITNMEALRDSIMLGGAAATLTDGAADAEQKIVTVDSTLQFVAGCYVEYQLVGGVVERNQVDMVDSGTQLTLITNIGTGGIANNSVIAVIPLGFYNAQKGIFNVLDYGAAGNGTTDDTAAIQAAIAAAPAGSIIHFPRGTYKVLDGFLIEKSLTIDGSGSTIVLTTGGSPTNQNAFWFRSNMDSDSASKPWNGPPADLPTFYRTFSGAVVEGVRTFTLASVTGLTEGMDCVLYLGEDPYDATQPFLTQWNRVASIAGSDVTFELAVPEDIDGTSHKCLTYDAIVENCGIHDIAISYDGTFTPEVAIFFTLCRNVYARNIVLSGMPRGLVVDGSANVRIENIYATAITQYAMLGGYQFTNLYANNIVVEDSYNAGLYFESQGRGALVENMRIGRGATATTGAASVMVIGGCRGILLKNFQLTHTVACIDATFSEAAEVRTEDWYLWNSEYHNKFPLVQHSGLLYHNEKLYRHERHWTGTFPLRFGLGNVLPSGVYKDVRVFTTDTANITYINLNTLGGTIETLLTANTLVRPAIDDLTHVGNDVSYPFNNTEAHTVDIVIGVGMTAADYIIFDITYYEPAADDDDASLGLLQYDGFNVIDARADDTINASTWDATTAGVLDALRDAMIAHGLIAAA